MSKSEQRTASEREIEDWLVSVGLWYAKNTPLIYVLRLGTYDDPYYYVGMTKNLPQRLWTHTRTKSVDWVMKHRVLLDEKHVRPVFDEKYTGSMSVKDREKVNRQYRRSLGKKYDVDLVDCREISAVDGIYANSQIGIRGRYINAEIAVTFEYMLKYGIEKVRGGSYCQVELALNKVTNIKYYLDELTKYGIPSSDPLIHYDPTRDINVHTGKFTLPMPTE